MNATPTAQLGDVASFVRGITFKPDDVVSVGSDGSVACMRTKNVQSDLDLSDVWGIPDSFVKRDNQYLAPGDLLVSTANSWNLVGKCCWVPNLPWRTTFGGFISVLRGNCDKIQPRYLYHWFASPRIQATVRSFGQKTTNISNLNIERCLHLPIPLPPLREQRRIAEILDKADVLRAKRRATLAQLDTLTQSIFLDMFGDPGTNPKGWPSMPMSTLFAETPTFGTMIPPSAGGGRWLSLRVANIQDWKLDLTDQKFVDLPNAMIARHSVRDGDVLLARAIASREHLGKAVVVHPGGREWAFDSHLMRLRFDRQRAEPEYIRELLRTNGGRQIFLRATRRSAVQFNINTKEISALQIPVSPIRLQCAFVRRVAHTETLRRAGSKTLEGLDALFTALQHRAFKGEL